jgi:hypothetical protein
LCHSTTAWNTISGFEARSDGRGAILALIRQYMGSDVQQVLIRRAETFLENARYDGKSKNFDFAKFIGKFRQAVSDLGPEDRMSEQRQVTKLVRAFQVPELRHLDAMITGDPLRRANFEATVVFLSDQIASNKTKNQGSHQRDIAVVNSKDKGKQHSHKKTQYTKHKGKGGGKSEGNQAYDPKDPLKFYSQSGWWNLTPEQQATSRKNRKAAGIKPGGRNVSALKQVKKPDCKVAAITRDSDSESETETESESDDDGLQDMPQARTLNMTQRLTQDAKERRLAQEANKQRQRSERKDKKRKSKARQAKKDKA